MWCLLLTFSELFGWWRLISPVSLTRPSCRNRLMQTVTMGPGWGGPFRAACSPSQCCGVALAAACRGSSEGFLQARALETAACVRGWVI